MAVFQLKTEQKIPADLAEIWDFISSPSNLKRITPDHMGFEITSGELTEKMYPGMIIKYKVKPLLGIAMNWVTEITHVVEQEYFVDEQRVGPYAMWHHEHKLKKIDGGVLMEDLITYRPPLGYLGNIANSLIIKRQLKGIFEYRKKAVEEIFGKYIEMD